YTASHSSRVAAYARATALRLGLQAMELDEIVMAALLHDIGQIGVPNHVLLKKAKLGPGESVQVEKHTELGWLALKNIDDFKSIGSIVLHHHERIDGTGYPNGLKGDESPSALELSPSPIRTTPSQRIVRIALPKRSNKRLKSCADVPLPNLIPG